MPDELEGAPMSIEAMPVATRRKIAACAAKQGLTAAEWLVRAVDNQANLEAGNKVILPGQDKPDTPTPAPISVAELASLLTAVAAVGTATALPPGIVREAYAAARLRLREARGLTGNDRCYLLVTGSHFYSTRRLLRPFPN